MVLETAESSEFLTTARVFACPDLVHPPGPWISSIVHRVFVCVYGLEPFVAWLARSLLLHFLLLFLCLWEIWSVGRMSWLEIMRGKIAVLMILIF